MRTAETVLGIIRDRGRRGLPLEDVYRQLFNPALYLQAYGRLAANRGALTPGVTAETADGMAQAKILAIIAALKQERYRWKPARRVYIEKQHSTKKRPLGMPTWSDKLVQEVVRSILEAYYEPQFSPHSHGFRRSHGCHTALAEVHRQMKAVAWFIEGDISQCFDRLDHTILLSILRERIHDNRFLRLIENLLKAGYLEDWRYHATYSGTPQGGVVSPILANIYLDRLDQFVEGTLLPAYNRGEGRRNNPQYQHLVRTAARLRRAGRFAEAQVLQGQYQQLPSMMTADEEYRNLRYVRYADDFLLGLAGPRNEAEAIKRRLGEFLRDALKLELSEAKTLITHARSDAARFLGYEVVVLHNDQKRHGGRRSINGAIGLRVPADVIKAKCQPYIRRGKPIHRAERMNDSVYAIVTQYQQEFRGLAAYYQLAYNRSRQLTRLRWIMERSLVKTLAAKLRISVPRVYRRYGTLLPTDRRPTKGLVVTVAREGQKPLVAQWGGISLRWRKAAVLNDVKEDFGWSTRTDLLQRLLADSCELCGSQETVQVHHVRHLRTLKRRGRTEPSPWVKHMAMRQRKTLVVCHECHKAIHVGRSTAQ